MGTTAETKVRTVDEIKAERARYNITLFELERASGVNETTIYRILNRGSNTTTDTVKKLSDGIDAVIAARNLQATSICAGSIGTSAASPAMAGSAVRA